MLALWRADAHLEGLEGAQHQDHGGEAEQQGAAALLHGFEQPPDDAGRRRGGGLVPEARASRLAPLGGGRRIRGDVRLRGLGGATGGGDEVRLDIAAERGRRRLGKGRAGPARSVRRAARAGFQKLVAEAGRVGDRARPRLLTRTGPAARRGDGDRLGPGHAERGRGEQLFAQRGTLLAARGADAGRARLGHAEPIDEPRENRVQAVHGRVHALIGRDLAGAQLVEIGAQRVDLGRRRRCAAGSNRLGDGPAGRPFDHGLHRGLVAQGHDLGQQFVHRPFEAGERGIGRAGLQAARQGEDLALQRVEVAGAGTDAVDLLREPAQERVHRGEVALGRRGLLAVRVELLEAADQVADGIDADLVDAIGQRLDPAEQMPRVAGGGEPAADLLQERSQLRDLLVAGAVLKLRDLAADRLQPLGEAVDALGAGKSRDQVADLVEFAVDGVERAAVGVARGGDAERAVGAARQPLDLAHEPGVDVVGDFLGEMLDLPAHRRDRLRESRRLADALDVRGERAHRLFQGADVAAGREAAEGVAQTARLGLQFGDRRGGEVGFGGKPPHAAPRSGRARIHHGSGRVKFALAAAHILDRLTHLGDDRAAAPAERTRAGELLVEVAHPLLDLGQALADPIDLRAAFREPRLAGLGRAGLRLAQGVAVFAERAVERVEPAHHLGDRGADRLGREIRRRRRRRDRLDPCGRSRVGLGVPGVVPGQIESGHVCELSVCRALSHRTGVDVSGPRPVRFTAVRGRGSRRAGRRLPGRSLVGIDDGLDPGLQGNAGALGNLAGGLDHLRVEAFEAERRVASHRRTQVGSFIRPEGRPRGCTDGRGRDGRVRPLTILVNSRLMCPAEPVKSVGQNRFG